MAAAAQDLLHADAINDDAKPPEVVATHVSAHRDTGELRLVPGMHRDRETLALVNGWDKARDKRLEDWWSA